MAPRIMVRERERDDNLGIQKKDIRFSSSLSISTPTKSYVAPYTMSNYDPEKLKNLTINEISRRIDERTLDALPLSGQSIVNDIKRRFLPDRINVTIPHLRIKNRLNPSQIISFSNFLYCASESSIILPTVDSSFFKEWKDDTKKRKIYNQKKIDTYISMILDIITEIKNTGNSKPFIGMIPIIPIFYLRRLFNIYQKEGITSFLLDASTKDILGASEFEFRQILSNINQIVPLEDSFIYASNVGFGLFRRKWTLADDFLSLFAYVDALGGTFKARGFDTSRGIEYAPRAKVFSKDEYAYNLYSYSTAEIVLGISRLNRVSLRDYNEKEQFSETEKLGDLIGNTNMINYILQKDKVRQEEIKFNRLVGIANIIRP